MIGDVATGSASRSAAGTSDADESASDNALVALAHDGPAAFAALYVRYVDLVYRFCYRRLGDRMAAEDATSRIFERALRALPRYRAGSFRSWLFTIARNTITDLYRSERATRTERRIPESLDLPEPRPGPEQQAIAADDARWVRGLLRHLTEEQRRVVELRLAGLTDIEIATVLGQSRGSVRTLQYRAIQKLRTILVPEASRDADPDSFREAGDDPRATTLEGSTREPFLVFDGVLAVTAFVFDAEGGPRPVFLHGLDAETGEPVWEPIELPTLATLAAADGSLFVADALHETGALRTFDIRTGEPRWTWEGAGPFRSPAVVDGALYVADDGDGTVHRLNAATGKPDWSVRLGYMGDPFVTGDLLLVIANGTISAVAGDGEAAPVAPGMEPPDLSGLPLCAPPRPVPNEPLSGEPATTIDVETRLIEPIGDSPVSEDGRPVESTTWPQMVTANLPMGERATVEEVGEVRATLDAMGDCTRRPEGTDQIPAFFSDDFFRRGIVTPDPDGYELTWNRQPEGDEMDRLEVFALDDGRVGAATVADSGSGIFLAFVEVDGAWLIDEFYEVVPEYFEGPIG